MCQPVLCSVCRKVTWTGCGEHVEQALAGIPHEHLCAGHDQPVAQPVAQPIAQPVAQPIAEPVVGPVTDR